jgi:hypothetical protein
VIRVERGGTIVGTVRAAGGAALSEIVVRASWQTPSGRPGETDHQTRQVRTREDGSFRLAGLPAVPVDLSVEDDRAESRFLPATEERVLPGGPPLTFALEEGVRLEGEVVGPRGEAVTTGWVTARPKAGDGWGPSAHANLDHGNRFRLGPLRPGLHVVEVRPAGGLRRGRVEAQAPASGLRLRLESTWRAEGRVVGSDVGGFSVQLVTGDHRTQASVAPDGRFALEGQEGGPGLLVARSDRDDRYGLVEGVAPGRGPYEIALVRGASIEGKVEGFVVGTKGGEIRAEADRGFSVATSIEPDGAFRLRGLPPGSYGISAWAPGGSVEGPDAKVEAGASGVKLQFTPTPPGAGPQAACGAGKCG